MSDDNLPGLDDLTTDAGRRAYTALIDHTRETALLGSTAALLGWDQETLMPPRAAAHRSQQRAQLARMVHERSTDARVEGWLADCEADPALAERNGSATAIAAVNVRELRRSYDRGRKLPADLVEARSKASSLALQSWKAARAADDGKGDFGGFADSLDEMIRLSRQVAECYGWGEGEAWDALADGYEPGCTAAEVEGVFTPLREQLVALLDTLRGGTPPEALALELPVEQQAAFGRKVAEALGFDFDRGRLDTSTHPFCGGTHCNDVRMTTRFKADDPLDALGSTMHESGHALYEQGLGEEHIGTPMGAAVSLGIHESQSRMIENQVGRSRAFWRWAGPALREHFGAPVAGLTDEQLYAGANVVQPSYIRVEADEATYNLHVMLRFELERALIGGRLDAADLPAAWNERFRDYLGIEVPDDARGCLQDIHWAMGLIGYFPTYTLGNLYSAQLFETARDELGDLDPMFAAGEFAPLREWLREKIHRQGKRYRAARLCEVVTGAPLSSAPLLRHLEGKLLPLYGLG